MQLPAAIRVFWRSRPTLTLLIVLASMAAAASVSATLLMLDVLRNGPMPYNDSSRQTYVFLQNIKEPHFDTELLSEDDYSLMRRGLPAFDSVGISTGESTSTARVGITLERLRSNSVTSSLFRTFGTRLIAGRVPDDWDEAGHNYVIVSCGLWRSAFGGVSDVVGRTIELDGHLHTITGVLPCNFQIGFYLNPELLVPFTSDPSGLERRLRRLLVFGHLNGNSNLKAAQAQLDVLSHQLVKQPDEDFKFRVTTIRDQNDRLGREIGYTLLFVTGIFLVAMAANLISFFSLRMRKRSSDFVIREMLGARPSEAATWLAQEVCLVIFLVLLGGLFVGPLLAKIFVTLGPNGILPDASDLRTSPQILGKAIIGAALIGFAVFLSTLAIWRAQKRPRSSVSSIRIIGSGKTFLYSILSLQAAFVLLLLIIACSLSIRSIEIGKLSPGFVAEQLLTLRSTLILNSNDSQLLWFNSRQALAETAGRLHAVNSALVDSLPFVYTSDTTVHCCTGPHNTARWAQLPVLFHRISPNYFDVMQIPILVGRTVSEGRAEIVVSKEFVHECCGGQYPVGSHVNIERSSDFRVAKPLDAEIVGVVGDVHEISLDTPVFPEIYVPTSADPRKETTFIFKFSSAVPGPDVIRTALQGSTEAALTDPQLLSTFVDVSLRPYRTKSAILGILGAIGVVLCALGFFSVIANAVTERRKDLALRIALGAGPKRIVWESIKPSVIAIGSGGLFALLFYRVLSHLLSYFSTQADVLNNAGVVSASLVFITLMAAGILIPALECGRIPPATVLREL